MLHIVVEREGQPRKELRFAKDEVVVGREAEHDLQLAFEDGASRQHCRLFVERGQHFIEDLGSRNGTKVNGKRIAGKTPLTPADEVEVGKVKIRLGGQAGAAKPAVRPRGEPEPAPAPKVRTKPAPEPAPKVRAKPEPEPAPKVRAKPEPEPAPKTRAKPEPEPAPKARTKPAPAPAQPEPDDGSIRVNLKAAAAESAAAPEPEGKPSGPVNDENEACRAAIDPLARRWRELGRPGGLLLHGPQLARGLAWIAGDRKLRPRPSELHREFIQASRDHRRHHARDLAIGAGAFVLSLVGGSVTARALYADIELKRGGPGTDAGPGQCTPDNPAVKRADQLAQRAGEQTDVELAILAGARALAAADGACARQSEAERVLRDALSRQRSRVIGRSGSPIVAADVGRDDRDVVTVDEAGGVTLWDRTGASSERPLQSNGARVAVLGPEGRWLAVGTASGAVDLWDLAQRSKPDLARQLEGHRDPITAIGFSEDGRLLATGDRRGTIRIWDMRGASAGNNLGELRKHTGAIEQLVFRDGGTRLYTLGGKQAYAWDLQEGKRKGKELLLAIGGDTTAMAVNGEGDEVVVGDSIGQVLRWKVRSLARATPEALTTHKDAAVVDLAFLPKSRAILSLGTDKNLMVTELDQMMREGGEPLSLGLRGLEAEPLALAADPTGRRIAVSARNHKIYVWDVLQRQSSAQPVVTFDEHTGTIESVLPTYDGNSLLSASADGTVRLWPLQSVDAGGVLAVLSDHQGPVSNIGLATNGGRLLSVGLDKAVRAWRLDDRGTPRRMFERTFDTPVGAVELSPDGRWAAVGVDRQIQLYDLASGDRDLRPVERSNHNEAVSRIAFNPDGRWMVTADYSGTINTWSMRQEGPEESPTRTIALGHNVTALALAPTSLFLAAAGDDNRVTLWAMNGNSPEHVVAQHDKTVLSLTFSNGGEYLVSTSDDARALLRKVDKGRTESPTERSAIPHDQRVRVAAFSPDKRWLATGSDDGAIVLTDLERDTERKVLRKHDAAIVGLAFEPGGEVLVSASLDKTARLWLVADLDRGGETRSIGLTGHSGPLSALRVDGGGRLVVTAGADGSIRVWPLKHDLLIQLACRAVGRDLRDDEWAQLYPSEPIEPLCAK